MKHSMEVTKLKHFGFGFRRLRLSKAKNLVIHVGKMEFRFITLHTTKPVNTLRTALVQVNGGNIQLFPA